MLFYVSRRPWGAGCYIFTCPGAPGEQDVTFLRVPAPLGSRMYAFLRVPAPAGRRMHIFFHVPAPLGWGILYTFLCNICLPVGHFLCIRTNEQTNERTDEQTTTNHQFDPNRKSPNLSNTTHPSHQGDSRKQQMIRKFVRKGFHNKRSSHNAEHRHRSTICSSFQICTDRRSV